MFRDSIWQQARLANKQGVSTDVDMTVNGDLGGDGLGYANSNGIH